MRLSSLCALALTFTLACGPQRSTSPSREVNFISCDELCRIYRHNPKDRTFSGQLVQCILEPRTYRVKPGMLEASYFGEDRPGCVQFECATTPANNEHRLVVTGRVHGIVRDGIQREATTDYYLSVVSCSVTMLDN